MRAVETYKPVPSSPLYDIGVQVVSIGDRYRVDVFPKKVADDSLEASNFSGAYDEAFGDVQGFSEAFGHNFFAEHHVKSKEEWISALNAFFASQKQPEVTNSLLSQRGRSHA